MLEVTEIPIEVNKVDRGPPIIKEELDKVQMNMKAELAKHLGEVLYKLLLEVITKRCEIVDITEEFDKCNALPKKETTVEYSN